MNLARIIDLVGKDVDGMKVDIRSRNLDGSLRYPIQEGEPITVTLRSVRIKRERGEKWLRWEWKPLPVRPDGIVDCGFSGIRFDCGEAHTVCLMVDDTPNFAAQGLLPGVGIPEEHAQ